MPCVQRGISCWPVSVCLSVQLSHVRIGTAAQSSSYFVIGAFLAHYMLYGSSGISKNNVDYRSVFCNVRRLNGYMYKNLSVVSVSGDAAVAERLLERYRHGDVHWIPVACLRRTYLSRSCGVSRCQSVLYVCIFICSSEAIQHVTIEMTMETGRTRLTALTAALKYE